MTTWTPVTKQVEVWTERQHATRVFDPVVFDSAPVFDTGSSAGVWNEKIKQPEIWTEV